MRWTRWLALVVLPALVAAAVVVASIHVGGQVYTWFLGAFAFSNLAYRLVCRFLTIRPATPSGMQLGVALALTGAMVVGTTAVYQDRGEAAAAAFLVVVGIPAFIGWRAWFDLHAVPPAIPA